MTICELIKTQWRGGNAQLKTRDGKYDIHLDENGDLVQHHPNPFRIPAHILCGNEWELEYPEHYLTEDVLKALNRLNPEMRELDRSEWNDWCHTKAKNMIYAVARALNYKIEKMRKV